MHAYIRKGAIALAAIGAVVGFVGSASALTVDCDRPSPPGGIIGYVLDNASAVECFPNDDSDATNDSTAVLNAANLFGSNTWTLADKSDDGVVNTTPPVLTITGAGQTASTPTWAITTGPFTYEKLVIVLKQSTTFAAFLIDQSLGITATGFAGTWGTQGPGDSVNALSHASLYYVGAAPIPLPLGAWLALTAAGGLVVLRRRKAAVTA